ncbi:MAG: DUF3109 family protein [Saprospiraceae bacterium]
MLVIDNVLISEEILQESFHCHLEKCKGACCWEGDYGAPLLEDELVILDKIQDKMLTFVNDKSKEYLSKNKGYVYEKKQKIWATKCHEDGSCIYVNMDPKTGIALCGIEQAFYEKEISFPKPLSCHLYPIRITRNENLGFEAWNYDQWDICHAACQLGTEKKMPIFRFVKQAIVRAKGEDFYEQLEAAYSFYMKKNKS